MIKVIERTKIWFSISLAIILVGVVLFFARGLNYGIDFKGGTKLVIEFGDNEFKPADVNKIIANYTEGAVSKVINDTQYEIKSANLDEAKTSELFKELKEKYKLEDKAMISQEQISASVGRELTIKTIIAVAVACVAMLIYIGIRFEFDFGFAAIVALLHDVFITMTVYLVFNITVNSPFIAAMLTIVGYSINDTIVVFDRIRENAKGMRRSNPTEIANKSINQTISRSINTSLTTLVVIGSVTYFVPTVREFTVPLLVGIAAGTYSSIFIASPVWVLLKNKKNKKVKAKIA